MGQQRPVGEAFEGADTRVQVVCPVDKLGNVISGGGGSGSAAGGAASYLSPGDFAAAYASATSLTLTKLPFPPMQEQIVQVAEYDGDNLIAVYSQADPAFDFTWAPAADSSQGTLTVATATFGAASDFVVQLAGPERDSLDVTTDFGGPYTHQSPRDFDVAHASATTLDFGGVTPMVMDPDVDDIRAVVEIATGGQIRMTYTRREWAFTWAGGGPGSGTGTLTIAGATLQATSTFIAFVEGPEHGIQRADAGGGIAQTVKRVQHQDETGGILRSLVSIATAGFVKLTDGTVEALLTAANTARAAGDIVLSVQQLDASGAVPPAGDVNTNAPFAKLTDGSEDLGFERADAAGAAATIVAPTKQLDLTGAVQPAGADAATAITMIQLSALIGMTGEGIYRSGIHFTAVQNAATEIDISGGFPTIVDIGQFVGVAQISSAGAVTVFYPHQNVFSWDAANARLTVTGATFAGTDTFVMVIAGADRYASDPGNYGLMAEVSPYPLRADSAGIELISAAQDFTAAWADLGPEIPMFGFNKLKLWLTFDINDSTDLRVRVLEKHESAGAEEYEPVIETYSASDIKFEEGYWELNVDTDLLHPLIYQGDGATPYMQVQIMAGTLGGGTDAQIDAAYYTRSTFGG